MKVQKDIKEIIDEMPNDIPVDESIEKLNGYFKQYFWNNHLRVKIGELYLKKSDFVQAGKMLYFIDNPNELEKKAITRFIASCKNNYLLIFNTLINKSKIPRGIDLKMSSKIFDLILKVSNQEGALPTGIVRWICNYERIRNIEIRRGWIQNYSNENNTTDIND